MKSDIMDIDLSKTQQADKSRKEIEAHMKKVTFFKYLQCQFSISISIFNVKNIFDFIRIYNVTKYFKCSISSNGNFQLTGASEVPWVFIGGRFIGGAEETVAAHKFDLVNINININIKININFNIITILLCLHINHININININIITILVFEMSPY